MNLEFTPDDVVDAKLIGLTQTVQAVENSRPLKPKGRGISGSGGTAEEGTELDQTPGLNNPIYAVQSKKSSSLSDEKGVGTYFSFGRYGWRYQSDGKIEKQNAQLIDDPGLPDVGPDSWQIFETAALATKGRQKGTYYGSVRWGWHKDGAGNLGTIKLQPISQGTPSSTFLKAANIWNQGRATGGVQNVKLPVAPVWETTATTTLRCVYPLQPVKLDERTRLQIDDKANVRWSNRLVTVVDGVHTGKAGRFRSEDWRNLVLDGNPLRITDGPVELKAIGTGAQIHLPTGTLVLAQDFDDKRSVGRIQVPFGPRRGTIGEVALADWMNLL